MFTIQQQRQAKEGMSFEFIKSKLIHIMHSTEEILAHFPIKSKECADSMSKKQVLDYQIYLKKIQARIQDSQFKLLICGDLNNGKSTLVNALVKREVVPTHQEPCTNTFIELLDSIHNHQREEIHAYSDAPYKEYILFEIDHIHSLVNSGQFKLLKVYLNQRTDESLLQNTSIIDSPGLNIDSITNTNLFTKQQEIDIILFVISAENHLTQSGIEFLKLAQKEKTHLFIIVNRFDVISRKDNCKKDIMNQIHLISPNLCTESHQQWIHFVSSKQYLNWYLTRNSRLESLSIQEQENKMYFETMQDALKDYILQNRIQSKLLPAKTFVSNVLNECLEDCIMELNQMEKENDALYTQIQQCQPIYKDLKSIQTQISNDIDSTIESISNNEATYARNQFAQFLLDFELLSESVDYPGILFSWHYAKRLRDLALVISKNRIQHCLEHAKESVMEATLSRIQSYPQIPYDKTPRELNYFFTPILPNIEFSISFTDLFLFGFKESLDHLYIPSLAVITGSVAGYSTLTRWILRTTSIAQIGKIVLLGASMAGLGILAVHFSDMKSTIQKKVKTKLMIQYQSTSFIERRSEEIASRTRKALRSCLWDFQSHFHFEFFESERRTLALESLQKELKMRMDKVESTKDKIIEIQQQIVEIEF